MSSQYQPNTDAELQATRNELVIALQVAKVNSTTYYETVAKLKSVDYEFARREVMRDVERYTNDIIRKLDGFELLHDSELSVIVDSMDKDDYTECGHDRFIDYTSMCKEVINVKRRYPNWSLLKAGIKCQYETYPPENVYGYTYVDEDGEQYKM